MHRRATFNTPPPRYRSSTRSAAAATQHTDRRLRRLRCAPLLPRSLITCLPPCVSRYACRPLLGMDFATEHQPHFTWPLHTLLHLDPTTACRRFTCAPAFSHSMVSFYNTYLRLHTATAPHTPHHTPTTQLHHRLHTLQPAHHWLHTLHTTATTTPHPHTRTRSLIFLRTPPRHTHSPMPTGATIPHYLHHTTTRYGLVDVG